MCLCKRRFGIALDCAQIRSLRPAWTIRAWKANIRSSLFARRGVEADGALREQDSWQIMVSFYRNKTSCKEIKGNYEHRGRNGWRWRRVFGGFTDGSSVLLIHKHFDIAIYIVCLCICAGYFGKARVHIPICIFLCCFFIFFIALCNKALFGGAHLSC